MGFDGDWMIGELRFKCNIGRLAKWVIVYNWSMSCFTLTYYPTLEGPD
jgi:hypothetical protein